MHRATGKPQRKDEGMASVATQDFKVKDLALAEWGRKEIGLAEDLMLLPVQSI